jgi:hypothetical protein
MEVSAFQKFPIYPERKENDSDFFTNLIYGTGRGMMTNLSFLSFIPPL